MRSLRGAKAWVGRLSWSQGGDRDRLVVPSSDGAVRVYDLAQLAVEQVLEGHDRAFCAAFSPNDRCIASGGSDRTVRLWSASSGKLEHELDARAPVYAVAFSPDNTLAAGCADGVARLWTAPQWSNRQNLEGDSVVTDLTWVGPLLACAHESGPVVLWEPGLRRRRAVWERPTSPGFGLACSLDGRYLAGGYGAGGAVAIWDVETARLVRVLEGASGAVRGLSFSADGLLLAAASTDGVMRLWDRRSWEPVHSLAGERHDYWLPGVAFHPRRPLLAVPAGGHRTVHVYEVGALPEPANRPDTTVRYATAKVVLLGDAHAGKTSLGHRLANGTYREHPSTHGQQIWMLDALRSRREDGTAVEVLLWDLAGQHDYRVLHTLFLSDADVVLLVFNAAHRDDPLTGALYWLRAIQRAGKTRPMLLVGAQCDEARNGPSSAELEAFCAKHRIEGGYVATSALHGSGIEPLQARLREMLLRTSVTTTTTTVAFKQARDAVLALKTSRAAEGALLSLAELRAELTKIDPSLHLSEQDLGAALGDLVKHGHLREIQMDGGSRGLLLCPELLYNAAASLVVRARAAHHGLGAVDEDELFATDQDFPELPSMRPGERHTLLQAAARTLLERAVCLRESFDGKTLLIFPELVSRRAPSVEDRAMEPLVSYLVEGAIENLFAVLAVRLGCADFVVGVKHWHNQVDYQMEGGASLVLRAETRGEQLLYLELGRRGEDRALFFEPMKGLIERLLLASDVALTRFQATSCPSCQDRPLLSEVERNTRNGRGKMRCAHCGATIGLDPDTKVDSLAQEQTTVSTDKASADQRLQFQPDLMGLKLLVTGKAPPRCILMGDVERHWAKRWMRDAANGGVDVHVEPATALPEHLRDVGPPSALWIRAEAPPDDSSEARFHLLLPPGSTPPTGPVPRGYRIWDQGNPDRYFFVLLGLLCDLHRLPLDKQGGIRGRVPLVVCIHAAGDEIFADALRSHLAAMTTQSHLHFWTPRDIVAGEDRRREIARVIADAHIVVVLLSAQLFEEWEEIRSYMDDERKRSLVPVLVRSVALDGTPFEDVLCLPRDGTSIKNSQDQDHAWTSIVQELRKRLGLGAMRR